MCGVNDEPPDIFFARSVAVAMPHRVAGDIVRYGRQHAERRFTRDELLAAANKFIAEADWKEQRVEEGGGEQRTLELTAPALSTGIKKGKIRGARGAAGYGVETLMQLLAAAYHRQLHGTWPWSAEAVPRWEKWPRGAQWAFSAALHLVLLADRLLDLAGRVLERPGGFHAGVSGLWEVQGRLSTLFVGGSLELGPYEAAVDGVASEIAGTEDLLRAYRPDVAQEEDQAEAPDGEWEQEIRAEEYWRGYHAAREETLEALQEERERAVEQGAMLEGLLETVRAGFIMAQASPDDDVPAADENVADPLFGYAAGMRLYHELESQKTPGRN